jgi:hypothetical protein
MGGFWPPQNPRASETGNPARIARQAKFQPIIHDRNLHDKTSARKNSLMTKPRDSISKVIE